LNDPQLLRFIPNAVDFASSNHGRYLDRFPRSDRAATMHSELT
jgi:hypothetical protein